MRIPPEEGRFKSYRVIFEILLPGYLNKIFFLREGMRVVEGILFFETFFLFIFEIERQRKWGRGRESIPNSLDTVSTEPDWGLNS